MEDLDPYATLHISHDASAEEVRTAYKRACVLYHPDKHPEDKRTAAQLFFSKVQTSYTILSDPQQRSIYDRLGWKGIVTSWQLAAPQNTFEEVNRVLNEERKRLFKRPGLSTTTIQAQVDASGLEGLTNATEDDYILLDFLPGVRGVSIGQRFEQVFDNGIVGKLSLDVLSRSGIGMGSISGQLVKALTPFSRISVGGGVGSQKYVTASCSRQLIKDTFINFAFTGGLFGGVISPSFQISVSRMLRQRYSMTIAIVTERHGPNSGYSSGVVVAGQALKEEASDGDLEASCHVKNDGSVKLDVKYERSCLFDHKFKLKMSTLRPRVSFGVTRQFTENMACGASIDLSLEFGTVLKLSFTRYEYRFVVPIIISPLITSMSVLLSLSIPAVLYSLLQNGTKYLAMVNEKEYWEEFKATRKGLIQQRRDEAIMAQWLMEEQYSQTRTDLRITKAVYRERNQTDSEFDVKIPLQLLVIDNSLSVPENTLHKLAGFYDVSIGAEKELVVEYEYRGALHSSTFADSQPIVLPQRSHLKSFKN